MNGEEPFSMEPPRGLLSSISNPYAHNPDQYYCQFIPRYPTTFPNAMEDQLLQPVPSKTTLVNNPFQNNSSRRNIESSSQIIRSAQKRQKIDTTTLCNCKNNSIGDEMGTACDMVPQMIRGGTMFTGLHIPGNLETEERATSSLLFPSPTKHFSSELLQEFHNFKQFQATQVEHFYQSLEEKIDQQTQTLLASINEKVCRELQMKEVELQKVRCHNQGLEARLKDSAIEAYYWQSKAQNNEAIALSLRATLRKVIAQTQEQLKEGSGESELDEAASIHIDEKSREEDINGDKFLLRPCKMCRFAEVSILLLPCKHLCCCENCESSIQSCPLCHSPKNASIRVYLSS